MYGNRRQGGFGGRRNGGRSDRGEFGIGHGQPGANLKSVDWSQIQLKPFRKNFYTPSTEMTEQEVWDWRGQNEVKVHGEGVPQPIRTFEQAKFPANVLSIFQAAGFIKPTPIQAQGWPMALSGRDVVGVAQTGSGKTLAFVIPAVMHIMGQPPLERGDGPIALCVAPTRELACQIESEAKKFSSGFGISIGCVYGGAPKRHQESLLRNGLDLVICTPGRMLDFLEHRTTNLWRVTYLVFDEADRMLDMGFEKQIRLLVSQIRPDRQVLMWSATWPKEVQQLAGDFLKNGFIKLNVGSDVGKACETIQQEVLVRGRYEKPNLFNDALQRFPNNKVLVFTATKRMADQLSRQLNQQGWNTESIHGDKQQFERDRVLRDFKSGRHNIMIATDVAARGIHVDDISCVINYDFPQNCDDYIHRIGRTGRCGKVGVAITFFDPKVDGKKAGKLIRILTDANQPVPEELHGLSKRFANFGGRNRHSHRGHGRSRPY